MEDWNEDIYGNRQVHSIWHLERTQVFGDNFMYYKTDAYIAARTMTYCEFACLHRADFLRVLDKFPLLDPFMRRHTIKLLWQVRKHRRETPHTLI